MIGYLWALLICFFLLCSVSTYAEQSQAVYKGYAEGGMCSNFKHTDNSRKLIEDLNRQTSLVETNRQNQFYSFLPKIKCEDENNYLEGELQVLDILSKPFDEVALSPLCTYASLSHDTGKTYQDGCVNDRPSLTDKKPCLSQSYHKLVHNQITLAAQCFNLDPKMLYSLFTTESSLQVNIKPAGDWSADGIGQLMPHEAVKELNKVVDSNTKENRYKRYLRHYKINSSSNKCTKYFTKLEEQKLREEDPKVCNGERSINDKVRQDIYYTIAYMLLSAQTTVGALIGDNYLFEQDYSKFLNKVKYSTKPLQMCQSLKEKAKKENCLKTNSTLAVQKYFKSSNKLLDEAIKDLNENIYSTPIGPNNINRKIKSYFPSSNVYNSINKKAKLYKVLNHSFLKQYCDIRDTPKIENYNVDGTIRQGADTLFVSDVSLFLSDLRACKREMSLGYIDVFNSMQDSKKIINEVGFYHHNGGPHLNGLFMNYLSNKFQQGVDPKKVSYQEFTGDEDGSFKAHIVDLEGHSQASNFVYNTPNPKSGSRVAGRDSSTSLILNTTIKSKLLQIRRLAIEQGNLSDKQKKYLDFINTQEGFNKLCSQY